MKHGLILYGRLDKAFDWNLLVRRVGHWKSEELSNGEQFTFEELEKLFSEMNCLEYDYKLLTEVYEGRKNQILRNDYENSCNHQ